MVPSHILTTVEIPTFLPPSAIGRWGGCALKLVASAPGVVADRLPPGPEASVGILAHRVLERWARADGPPTAAALFDEEYETIVAALRADPRRAHFADLSTTKPLPEWIRLRAWVLERCDRFPRGKGGTTKSAESRAVPTGAERRLSSERLRLAGAADLVRKIGVNAYEIRDFKSGNVLGESGEIKPDIQLQLRAYGLMIVERDSTAQIRLVVDDGNEHEVAFGAPEQEMAREELEQVGRAVPPPGRVDVGTIAVAGSACWGCAIRHACPAYRAAAPGWWKNVPEPIERLPNDTWGQVVELRESAVSSAVDVVLVDASGRRVRVDGLTARHALDGASAGEEVAFFQLEATGPVRGFDGRRFHPRVFHELPRDSRERRAWTTVCFRGLPAATPNTGLG